MEKNKFATLAAVDVNKHIDKKETGKDKYGRPITLSYLSWAWAWDYFKRQMPDATYEIRHWGDKPYLYDENLGFMVETSITAGGETYTMWLPVMDGSNSAMKAQPQTFAMKRKDGTAYNKTIPAATMFDINKTIMRCLVKNMAMFGLGLYIYAGEDIPSDTDETISTDQIVDDSVPFAEPVKPAGADDWITANAFTGIVAKINDVSELQRILNEQRNNPRIRELAEIATTRKREILDKLQATGA